MPNFPFILHYLIQLLLFSHALNVSCVETLQIVFGLIVNESSLQIAGTSLKLEDAD